MFKLINSSPTKSCSLDAWPTYLLKECLDILVLPITSIVNLSLSEDNFPHQFKLSIVTPLIKKPSLPRNDRKNYRAVSGLNFISSVIERVVAYQVKEYLSNNNLNNIYQSAYKSELSTETTLLKIKNDIHLNFAEGKPTALVLLYLSAAVDTINHKQLTECLSSQFGFSELALEWFHS